jgi:hypothetical protein
MADLRNIELKQLLLSTLLGHPHHAGSPCGLRQSRLHLESRQTLLECLQRTLECIGHEEHPQKNSDDQSDNDHSISSPEIPKRTLSCPPAPPCELTMLVEHHCATEHHHPHSDRAEEDTVGGFFHLNLRVVKPIYIISYLMLLSS